MIGSACRCTDLPNAVFGAQDHRNPQIDGSDGLLFANLGLGPLYPHNVRKLRGYALHDGLNVNDLAVSDLRCGVIRNRSNLLPSTYDRAKRISEGYVLSMGAQLLCGFRVSFQKLTLRQVELLDQFVNAVFRSHLDHLCI